MLIPSFAILFATTTTWGYLSFEDIMKCNLLKWETSITAKGMHFGHWSNKGISEPVITIMDTHCPIMCLHVSVRQPFFFFTTHTPPAAVASSSSSKGEQAGAEYSIVNQYEYNRNKKNKHMRYNKTQNSQQNF